MLTQNLPKISLKFNVNIVPFLYEWKELLIFGR